MKKIVDPIAAAQKAVKVINQKIRRLARGGYKPGEKKTSETFLKSELYSDYKNTIMRNFDFRFTKDGVIQIKNTKQSYNKYQDQMINKLGKMQSYGDIVKYAKGRLKKAGIKKPTKEQIEKDINENEYFRKEIDDTLTAIYKSILENKLPTDIYDMYNHFVDHNTSNNEIQNMINAVNDWENLKNDLIAISDKLNTIDDLDPYIAAKMEKANSGMMTLAQIKQTIEDLDKYYIEYMANQD